MIKAFKFFTVTASANCLEKVLSPLMLKDDAGQEDGIMGREMRNRCRFI